MIITYPLQVYFLYAYIYSSILQLLVLKSLNTVFSVISVIVLFSYVITQTKIINTKCKRMRIHNVNVYGKGSPRTKITLHENLKFE